MHSAWFSVFCRFAFIQLGNETSNFILWEAFCLFSPESLWIAGCPAAAWWSSVCTDSQVQADLFILFLFFKKTYLLCIAVLEINRRTLVVASLTTETAGDLIRKWINRKFCHCCGVCLPDTTLLNTFNQTALYLAKLTGLKNWGQVCVCPM